MKIIRPCSVLMMGLFYIVSIFVEDEFLNYTIAFFTFIILVSFIRYLNRISFIMIVSLLFLSVIIYLYSNNFHEIINGFLMNSSVLAIFIFVPLLSIPITSKRYIKEIEVFLMYSFKSPKKYYNYMKIGGVLLGSVLNMGALSILYFLTDSKRFKNYQNLKLKALNRGFSLAFLWSPYFISIAVILSYFEVHWIELAFYGLLLTILSIAYEQFKFTESKVEFNVRDKDKNYDKRKIYELFIIITAMTLLIILIDIKSNVSIISIIPIISILTFFIWTYFIGGFKEITKGLQKYTQVRIPNMGNELLLFIGAGLFGTALISAGFDKLLLLFLEFIGISHVLLLIPLFGFIIISLSMLSIHPIVSVTVIALTISSMNIENNSQIYFALGLLLSWMITINISPFSGVNLILSNLSKVNVVIIGLKSNMIYSLGMWVTGYTIIIILYILDVF